MTGKSLSKKIQVKVKPRSRQTSVEFVADGQYRVKVKEAPDKGRANEAVIDALSEYLDIPKSKLKIVRGQTSSNKSIEIVGCE